MFIKTPIRKEPLVPGGFAPPIGPFAEFEYSTINDILEALFENSGPVAAEYINHIVSRRDKILKFHSVALQLHNPLETQKLGHKTRDFDTLVETLSSCSPAEFELKLPARTVVSRTLIDLLIYFWKLVATAVEEVLTEHTNKELFIRDVEHALSNRIYNRMVTELLIDVATNSEIPLDIRKNGVRHLIRMWEHGTIEATSRNLAPLMESIWTARQQMTVVFGAMLGVHEIFDMVRLGATSHFFEYFVEHANNEEVVYAFKEFLFGVPYEVLKQMEKEIEEKGLVDVPMELDEHGFPITDGSYLQVQRDEEGLPMSSDSPTERALRLYHFFKTRLIKAMGRRLSDSPGPKRTAEEFIIIYFLENDL